MITFTTVFVILFFIFVLQGIWLFISELAGKDLDLFTIIKFLSYYAPTIVPLVLPLSILLAGIMTFGSFAENYEFAAMKSSGISLQRAMKMLTFFNTGYKYSWDILQNVSGRKIQYVKLTPNSSKDHRKEILVGIDVQTKHIYTVIEVGKNGTKTTLTVNSFKTNQPLSKNHFTFTKSKYPNYYINKLD